MQALNPQAALTRQDLLSTIEQSRKELLQAFVMCPN